VLSALEVYKECEDYLEWCRENEMEVSNPAWLNYYKDMGKIYNEVEKQLGEIDAFINPFDYELKSGAFSALLRLYKS
jgi:hypothetical protein